ncbi:hypothetical protein [Flavobacterium sp.]|uniref:hypothetical protein n=1 Tax=Flavobacterium sp. TaxID=239 RepID=UPI0035281CDC
MKCKIYILLFYLFSIITLPSIRAIKVIVTTQTACATADSECETGKFVMSLNFNSVQFVKESIVIPTIFILTEVLCTTNFYKNNLFSSYCTTIWHPPKYSTNF